MKRLFVLILCFFLAQAPVCAGDGKATVETLVNIFVHWSGSANDKASYAKAGQFIDYKLMSERVLGQKRWADLSNQEKTDFVSAFRAVIEKRYYPRWRRIFHNASINYLNEQGAGADTLVTTRVKTSSSTEDIIWTLAGTDKVVSLKVGERDLIKRASSRFNKKLANSNFPDFLAWLKKESQSASPTDLGDAADTSKPGA